MKQKTQYELTVIIKPSIPENERMGIESKVVEGLEDKSGKILNVHSYGKKPLAYEIKSCQEGYYVSYEFETFPENISTIDSNLKFNNDILRYLIIKK